MARLPVISGKEAAAVFQRMGFAHRRTTASHMIYKMPGRATLSIPNHKELDAGLLRKLISDAGITVEEFAGLLD